MRSVFGSKAKIINVPQKSKFNIPFSEIVHIIELVIISYILYHHFFC